MEVTNSNLPFPLPLSQLLIKSKNKRGTNFIIFQGNTNKRKRKKREKKLKKKKKWWQNTSRE
jgi:hypothetical protein